MKKNFAFALMFILTIALAACTSNSVSQSGDNTQPSENGEDAGNKIVLSVYNSDEEALYSETVNFENANLLEIVSNIAELKVTTEDREVGKNITAMMDISYDSGQYWQCYINGEILPDSVPVSTYEVKDNDVIDFRYEKNEGEIKTPDLTLEEWPEDDWTKDLPKPPFVIGEIEIFSTDNKLTVNFSDAPHDRVTAYVEEVKAAGFDQNENGVLEDGTISSVWTAVNAEDDRLVEIGHADGEGYISVQKR
jgi:hypothetical protein